MTSIARDTASPSLGKLAVPFLYVTLCERKSRTEETIGAQAHTRCFIVFCSPSCVCHQEKTPVASSLCTCLISQVIHAEFMWTRSLRCVALVPPLPFVSCLYPNSSTRSPMELIARHPIWKRTFGST